MNYGHGMFFTFANTNGNKTKQQSNLSEEGSQLIIKFIAKPSPIRPTMGNLNWQTPLSLGRFL